MTPEEQKRANDLLNSGVSAQAVAQAIQSTRSDKQEMALAVKPSYTRRLVDEFKAGGEDIIESAQFGARAIEETPRGSLDRLSGAVVSGGGSFLGATRTLFSPITAGIQPVIQPQIEKVMETPEAQSIIETHSELSNKYPYRTRAVTTGITAIAELAGLKNSSRLSSSFNNTLKTTTENIKVPNLKEVFGLSKKEIVADDLLETIVDKKTGRTVDNQGIIDKVVTSEDDLLTIAEKRQLVQTDPELYKKYKKVLEDSEKDFANPTLHQQGINDFMDVFSDYKKVADDAGSDIGKIKDKVIKKKVGNIDGVSTLIDNFLEKNNVIADANEVIFTGNSPLKANQAQIKEVVDIVENIKKSDSMKDLILGMKQLDEKIVYGKGDDIGQSIQGLAKKVRTELKGIRDSKLTEKEIKAYDDYSNTISLIRDFEKGNIEQKMSVLLNSFGTMRDFKIKGVATELKRVTGQDVNNIAGLIDIFLKRLPKDNRNYSKFAKIVGDSGVPLTKFGLADKGATITKGIIKKILSTDIMKEIEKAGLTKYVTK